jgi:hypothetical protein
VGLYAALKRRSSTSLKAFVERPLFDVAAGIVDAPFFDVAAGIREFFFCVTARTREFLPCPMPRQTDALFHSG